jgi:glucose-1-phosphate adenylyltransferase
VPFGGKFRIIDFALSNFLNSGIYSTYVLTQFMSQSLTEHIQSAWNFGGSVAGHFVTPVPAQMRAGEFWFRGTADAIYQNLNLVRESGPDIVCIFGGDHIYRMDVSQMVSFHERNRADLTVAATIIPKDQASEFGVVEVDEDWRIVGFEEKPETPRTIPGDPENCLVSMGNYVFSRELLEEALEADAALTSSSHDFGKDVIPATIKTNRVFCYDFTQNQVSGQEGANTYWRDVGSIESYFEASMDLRMPLPEFNLYNDRWPIRSLRYDTPPAKFVHYEGDRRGRAVDSMVCEGTIISGALIKNSIIGRNVKVHSFCEITDSIIFDHVKIGRGSRINRCIVDKNNLIPENTVLSSTEGTTEDDHFISESGIVVVKKQPRFESALGTLHL